MTQAININNTQRFRVGLFLLGILAIVFREPEMFLSPRIWAEEATVFYAYARHHSTWDIFTTAHVGYLTLYNSIVSFMQAKLFSVENAATVSTYFGFLIQVVPVYVIVFTTHLFWNTPIKKIICMLIVITVTAPELYLNTTNSHFLFGLTTFLIMMVSPDVLSKFQKYFFRVLLFLGGLTRASVFFTPMFLVKAYKEKNKEKYIQAAIITACAIIQACVILYAIFFNNTYKRLSVTDFKTTRYRFIIDNFTMMPHSHLFDGQLFSIDIIILLGGLMGVFYGYLLFKNRKSSDYLIALISFVMVAILSTLGSLQMGGGPRYAYIPTCIFLMVLTSQIFEFRYKFIPAFMLAFFLSINAFYYATNINDWAYKPTYPKWKTEVAKWRKDTTYMPKIHPAFYRDDEWQVKL